MVLILFLKKHNANTARATRAKKNWRNRDLWINRMTSWCIFVSTGLSHQHLMCTFNISLSILLKVSNFRQCLSSITSARPRPTTRPLFPDMHVSSFRRLNLPSPERAFSPLFTCLFSWAHSVSAPPEILHPPHLWPCLRRAGKFQPSTGTMTRPSGSVDSSQATAGCSTIQLGRPCWLYGWYQRGYTLREDGDWVCDRWRTHPFQSSCSSGWWAPGVNPRRSS
jgi:hypothetical protein